MSRHTPSRSSLDQPRLLHVTTVPQTLRFLRGHIAFAKRRGWQVHALASPGALLDALGQELRVKVHAVAMPRRITPFRDLVALCGVIRVMRQIRPTIVDGHTPKGGLLAMVAATLCRVPVRIYHVHGLPLVTATGMKRWILQCTERISCRLAHQVLCVSRSVSEVAVSHGLCPAKKIKVLNHGNIDGVEAEAQFNPTRISAKTAQVLRQKYALPAACLVIGFVGRIVKDKGLIELERAWRMLREEFATLHLLIAGPFEREDPLPADVEAALRTDPRIRLAGQVDDPSNVFRIIDLFVLPTYREGFPVTLLEAQAMGLPVVATRIPGCIDAVRDGENGTLVPVRDADALSAAIRAYLRDAQLRHRHGWQGRMRVLRDFRPDVMREALYQEYVRLLRARGLSAPMVSAQAAEVSIEADWGCGQGVPWEPGHTMNMPRTHYRRWGKRLVDVLVSATALVVLSPVLLILALLVRMFLGRPILFHQVRTGLRQQRFTIVKFRTMTNACDATGALLPDTQRLSRLGRWLRTTSLDELPELLNVLKGEMSLVGPRPLLPRYDSFYSTREKRRFAVLPGITGWAQINGRNDLAWDDRLACDVWYADACSFWLDMKILMLTVIKVVRRDNVRADPGTLFAALDDERRQRAAPEPSSGT